MKSLTKQFEDWVRCQPADLGYDYSRSTKCAFAQFLHAAGKAQRPTVNPVSWCDLAIRPFVDHLLPRRVNDAVATAPWTFGALAERLTQSRQALAPVRRGIAA